jgi:hypothetical protein
VKRNDEGRSESIEARYHVALEPRGELAEVTPYHSIIGVWVMSNGSGLWARFEEIREVVLVPKERSEDK